MRGSAISSVTLAMTALLDASLASLAFLSFFLVRVQLSSYQTRKQCNLNLRIFRPRHSCRCLRSFLGATPAMTHALMLAELDCRLIRSVAHTTSIPTRHWL